MGKRTGILFTSPIGGGVWMSLQATIFQGARSPRSVPDTAPDGASGGNLIMLRLSHGFAVGLEFLHFHAAAAWVRARSVT